MKNPSEPLNDISYKVPKVDTIVTNVPAWDFDGYEHFQKFLDENEWYANSLDIVLEDYWVIFRTALGIGFKLGFDACSQ